MKNTGRDRCRCPGVFSSLMLIIPRTRAIPGTSLSLRVRSMIKGKAPKSSLAHQPVLGVLAVSERAHLTDCHVGDSRCAMVCCPAEAGRDVGRQRADVVSGHTVVVVVVVGQRQRGYCICTYVYISLYLYMNIFSHYGGGCCELLFEWRGHCSLVVLLTYRNPDPSRPSSAYPCFAWWMAR